MIWGTEMNINWICRAHIIRGCTYLSFDGLLKYLRDYLVTRIELGNSYNNEKIVGKIHDKFLFEIRYGSMEPKKCEEILTFLDELCLYSEQIDDCDVLELVRHIKYDIICLM